MCCNFLSSAGVWATESKGDHSGSARQLDSGSRCSVLLNSSPPEPFLLQLFPFFFVCYQENIFKLLKITIFSNNLVCFHFPRVWSFLSGEKKLKVKPWNSGRVLPNMQQYVKQLFSNVNIRNLILFFSNLGANTSTGEKSLKLPRQRISIKEWIQTLIYYFFWWKWWSGKDFFVLNVLFDLII